MRDTLDLAADVRFGHDAERTTRYHKGLVRDRLGVSADPEQARVTAKQAITSTAAVNDNPADLINVALEELIRARCELPAYSTPDRLAGRIRAEVNGTMFELVNSRISPADRARLLGLLERDPISGHSGFDRLKQPAPAATLSRLRQHRELIGWLDALGATDAWLTGVPAPKVSHFAGKAGYCMPASRTSACTTSAPPSGA